jgi:hypothetical protein
MTTWSAKTALCLLMLFLFPFWLNGQEGKADRPAPEEWNYSLQIREKGTRSEGRTGTLTKGGTEVTGKTEGEILETPFGKFRWFGKPAKDDFVFRDRGWLNQWSGGRRTIDSPGN